MQPTLVQAGGIGLNLALLVSWEWDAARQFLVLHMLNDTIYLHGAQGQAMSRLLEALAAAHFGQPPQP
jgi:hypothetical protein